MSITVSSGRLLTNKMVNAVMADAMTADPMTADPMTAERGIGDARAWPRRMLVGAVLFLCLLVFFRDALLTRLQWLYGDGYDGDIEVAILDHWYRVYTAGAAWDLTGYFHPYATTLGYNDTYFVPGIAFALFRSLGADPFLAAFASHVAMKALGFLGMYALLRRGLAVRTAFALVGAAVFATANASLLHMYHAQLLGVGLLAWLGFFALRASAALREDRPRALLGHGCAFALLYGATAFSAFYAAWFFALFLVVQLPIALLLMAADERRVLFVAVRRRWRIVLGCAGLGALALVPLFILYLPVMAAGAHHSWEQGPHRYLPSLLTLFNVGSGNLVWGGLPTLLGSAAFPGGETRFGFPVGLIAAGLFALLWAGRERARGGIVLSIGIALAVMLGLALRWPPDHSAWWLVHAYVPGAGAIRVVSRLLLFALVGVIAMVVVFLDRAPRPAWLTAVIVAGLLVEQVQLAAPLTLDRRRELAMLAAAGPPPAACAAFFVVSARAADFPVLAESHAIDRAWGGNGIGEGPQAYRHNVDAMLLATYYGRPTINGISSFNPPDWNLTDPDAPEYLARVRDYARRHRLAPLCGLDLRRAQRWFLLDGPAA